MDKEDFREIVKEEVDRQADSFATVIFITGVITLIINLIIG